MSYQIDYFDPNSQKAQFFLKKQFYLLQLLISAYSFCFYGRISLYSDHRIPFVFKMFNPTSATQVSLSAKKNHLPKNGSCPGSNFHFYLFCSLTFFVPRWVTSCPLALNSVVLCLVGQIVLGMTVVSLSMNFSPKCFKKSQMLISTSILDTPSISLRSGPRLLRLKLNL